MIFIAVGLDKGYGLTKPWYGCPARGPISCQAANSIRRLRLLFANWTRSNAAPPLVAPSHLYIFSHTIFLLLLPFNYSLSCFSISFCSSSLLLIVISFGCQAKLNQMLEGQTRLCACSPGQLWLVVEVMGRYCLSGSSAHLDALRLDFRNYHAM